MPAILDVDLGAIAANYQLLKQLHTKQSIAAVVKADAYGLGMKAVSLHLWETGCREFFVATLEEGIQLRALLPDAHIGVFNGIQPREEKTYLHHWLTPVLNSVGHIEQWEKATAHSPAILHVDTGMTRLGLSHTEMEHVVLRHHSFVKHSLAFMMSHLACAGDPAHRKNTEQLERFCAAMELLPDLPASLSNSSGLFLSPEFHFDLARPGCALYGINPVSGPNPMQQVARLSAPLLQVRTLDHHETVGYDATFSAPKGSRIAVAGLGYADGWPRGLGNKGSAMIGRHKVPVAGIISMDMLALDVSNIPPAELAPDTRVEFINSVQTVDDVARSSGTIGYEVLTRLGNRIERRYTGA